MVWPKVIPLSGSTVDKLLDVPTLNKTVRPQKATKMSVQNCYAREIFLFYSQTSKSDISLLNVWTVFITLCSFSFVLDAY